MFRLYVQVSKIVPPMVFYSCLPVVLFPNLLKHFSAIARGVFEHLFVFQLQKLYVGLTLLPRVPIGKEWTCYVMDRDILSVPMVPLRNVVGLMSPWRCNFDLHPGLLLR